MFIIITITTFLESDRLSTALISALIGQYASWLSNWTVCTITHTLKWLFFSLLATKILEFLVSGFQKEPYISQIFLSMLWLIGNRTLCLPIRSVIRLMIKQIGLLLCGYPILLTLVWLQTKLDSTQSCYHYLVHLPSPIGISWLSCTESLHHDLFKLFVWFYLLPAVTFDSTYLGSLNIFGLLFWLAVPDQEGYSLHLEGL